MSSFFCRFSFFWSPRYINFLSYNSLFLLALIINQIFVSFALVKGIVIVGYNFFLPTFSFYVHWFHYNIVFDDTYWVCIPTLFLTISKNTAALAVSPIFLKLTETLLIYFRRTFFYLSLVYTEYNIFVKLLKVRGKGQRCTQKNKKNPLVTQIFVELFFSPLESDRTSFKLFFNFSGLL